VADVAREPAQAVLPLFGALSIFQETVRRVADRALFARPIVVTNGQYRFLVAEQIAAIGAEADILLEPVRRDSGPAIAADAGHALARDDGAVIVALAADHVTTDPVAFTNVCTLARAAAEQESSRRGRRPSTATSAPARRSATACSRSKGSSRSPTPRPPRAT
jgi:mannose-1-phosphate guanylyltransferase